jgi:hypothetical protein
MGKRQCWTYSTPHGDFQIRENEDGYFGPYFKDNHIIGNFFTAEKALEDLCRGFPLLPESLSQWDCTLF